MERTGAQAAQDAGSEPSHPGQGGIVDTVQSLVVAFVFAMVFRAFVCEGFVIPTGSMAPTLMGAHIRLRSPATSYEYPTDATPIIEVGRRIASGQARDIGRPVIDPMISRSAPVAQVANQALATSARNGDRVLVLKYIAPFTAPKRWDVVVFKNPTDPAGDSPYYIKRLVGLPNETLLVADGDIFTGPPDGDAAAMTIQRKPEFVQRAVWQSVYDSDYQPVNEQAMEGAMRVRWKGAPWVASEGWDIRGDRTWARSSAAPASLTWDGAILPLDDWNAYNVYRNDVALYPTADLRVQAAIEIGSPKDFTTAIELGARGHVMRMQIGGGAVRLSVTPQDAEAPIASSETPWNPPAGSPLLLEFWHVDQSLSVFADGLRVATLDYELGDPLRRIALAHYGRTLEQVIANPIGQRPAPPTLSWSFSGSPFALRRVIVDRDLYYRPAFLNPNDQFLCNGEPVDGLAFACDPRKPATLGDGAYVMFGDNSAASRDSRLWGRPHQLVIRELGMSEPFIVPHELLIGQAWSVYFPAPLPMSPGGSAFIPDFGKLRFIR
jgi:signal peptidase I